MSKIREVVVAPKALDDMDSFAPSGEEKQAIMNVIRALAGRSDYQSASSSASQSGPSLGYKIAFFEPETYRIDAGRFSILYRFDGHQIDVDYIGVF